MPSPHRTTGDCYAVRKHPNNREGVTAEQKEILIRDTTAMLERVLNKAPQTTHVVIDEIDTDNWGFSGESVAFHRQQTQKGKGND